MAATHITEGATLIVPVTDQDRAVEFYAGALGFEKRLDFTYADGERWVEVAPPGKPSLPQARWNEDTICHSGSWISSMRSSVKSSSPISTALR